MTRPASKPLLPRHCWSARCSPSGAVCAPIQLVHAVMCLELVVSMLLHSAHAAQQPMTHEHWALWMRIDDPSQQDEPLMGIKHAEAHRCCLACGCQE